MIIKSGVGNGYSAKVTDNNQLEVVSESKTLQHWRSINKGLVFQVIGDKATLSAATIPILHIQNTSAEKRLVITYIRLQQVGCSAAGIDSTTHYFQTGFGRTYSSGGTAVTPVIVNRSSANVAEATCYDNNPTLAGTFQEIDRYYPSKASDAVVYNKEGSIILGLNDTFECRIVSADTQGDVYARVTMMFIENE